MREICIKSKLYDYSVEFVEDFEQVLRQVQGESAFVIDKNVYDLYQEKFAFLDSGRIFFMNAVESEKNMDTVMKVIEFWKSIGVKKNWKVYCFGGGITQDITTIASNLYLRNVEWIFFPTTLLSMCDSCIGGKCGINLGQYKNQIGVFYPPHKIYIDTRFVSTLTKQDYVNGWGELLKFSLTNAPDFYNEIRHLDSYIPCPKIDKYIYYGLEVKKKVIEEDEFESDLRRILNYGHTFGHALEAYTNNEIPHGEAVIWGIDVVNYIAWKEGLIDSGLYYDVKAFIKEAFIPEEIVIDRPEELFGIISTDKKVKGNTIALAVLDGFSHLVVYPMAIDEKLKALFMEYLGGTHEYYRN